MKKISILFSTLVFLFADAAFANGNPTPSKVDTVDTAWILIASALVMLMTPGLALFYPLRDYTSIN